MTGFGNSQESPRKSITYSSVVDLSHPIHPGIPCWPGDSPVQFETVAHLAGAGFNLRRISLGEHTGTHINAPGSFHAGGASIDSYSPESLIAPAVVIDLSEKTAANPDYLLSPEDIRHSEQSFGVVPEDSIVLLNCGWQAKWDNPTEFLGLDSNGVAHFPGFGLEAVRFLLDQRNVRGIGIDTHGVDGGPDQTFAVNRLVLEQPRIVLENLTNLDHLPGMGATLVIGILPLVGGTGSPASVLALVP